MQQAIARGTFVVLVLGGCASVDIAAPALDSDVPIPAVPVFVPAADAAAAAEPIDGGAILERVVAAMGGRAAIAASTSESVTLMRVQWMSGQGFTDDAPPIELARTNMRMWHDFEKHDIAIEHHNLPVYPYFFETMWKERVARGEVGDVDGADTVLGVDKRPMSGVRIAMRLKEQLLSSPALLLREVLTSAAAVERVDRGTIGGVEVARLHTRWRDLPIAVVVVRENGRLLQVETIEDEPMFGDMPYVVRYEDWRRVDGVDVPFRILHTFDARPVLLDTRSVVTHDEARTVEVDSEEEPSAEAFALGLRRAHFYFEWIGVGFPEDYAALSPEVNFVEAAPGVFVVTGAFHNILVVEMGNDELVICEAPFSPEKATILLDRVAQRWPTARVTKVISTHAHWDHLGGIRTFIARGIEVVAPAAAAPVITRAAQHAKTLVPDELAKKPAAARITVVDDKMIVGDRIDIYAVETLHVNRMLLVHLPKERALFMSDLFNPGLFGSSGFGGWVVRTLVGSQFPQSLLKAGTFAQQLESEIARLHLDVNAIVGGHGPEVLGPEDLASLAAHGDRAAYVASRRP